MENNNEAGNQQSQDQQGNSDKIERNYNANLKKLVAILGGEDAFKKDKVPNSELGAIVADLVKDKKKKVIDTFKTEAIALLDAKVVFDQEVRKAEADFKKTVDSKKKEFTEKMTKLFQIIDNVNDIEKSYYSSFSGMGQSEASAGATGPAIQEDEK